MALWLPVRLISRETPTHWMSRTRSLGRQRPRLNYHREQLFSNAVLNAGLPGLGATSAMRATDVSDVMAEFLSRTGLRSSFTTRMVSVVSEGDPELDDEEALE